MTIIVNLPNNREELFQFQEATEPTDAILDITVQHPRWTSLVITITRKEWDA